MRPCASFSKLRWLPKDRMPLRPSLSHPVPEPALGIILCPGAQALLGVSAAGSWAGAGERVGLRVFVGLGRGAGPPSHPRPMGRVGR